MLTRYLDLYREKKDIAQEILLKRLKRLDPFSTERSRVPYPHAMPIDHTLPSWQRQEIKKERLGWGKYASLYRNDYDSNIDTDDKVGM